MALGLAPSLHPPLSRATAIAPERDRRRERLRRLAVLASTVLHAVVLALLLGLWKSPHVDEFPTIQVALVPGMGDAGKAGGSGGGATKEGQFAQGSEAPTPNNAADATPPESNTKETVDTQPVPPTPEPRTTETPPAPPTPPSPVTASTTTPAPTKPVAPMPPPPPRKPRPPQPTAVAAAPPPPQPAPPTPQPAPSPAPLPQLATAPVPQATPGTPGSGTGRGGPGGVGQGETGTGHGIIGNGNGPGDDYLERVRRWIEKYKVYPETAKKQKQQGVPLLSIRLQRDGTVLDVHIEKSSGFPLLDEAAVKAVRDASPVPPFPPSYEEQEIEYGQPFSFHLGFFDRVLD